MATKGTPATRSFSPLRQALRGARRQIRHVNPVAPRSATGLVAEVYRAVEREFGMLAPPVVLHAPAPKVLAASWSLLRESLLADGAATRAAKEVVATAVSEANRCPYCVVVHEASLGQAGESDLDGALREWIRGGAEPFPPEHRAEYLAVRVTFEYLNRMVNVFLPDSPFPGAMPAPIAASASGVLGRVAVGGAAVEPGRSAGLLPECDLPAELGWAATRPAVANALAAATTAFEEAGERSVPAPVRDLVRARLAGARPEGPSRSWVTDDVATLPPQHRNAGRLALLTALAAYQVTDDVVEEYRREGHDDAALIELTAWASWTTARWEVGIPTARSASSETPAEPVERH